MLLILLIGSYFLTYKFCDKTQNENDEDSEEQEESHVDVTEAHNKLGSWSIVFYRVFQICLMLHQVSHEFFDPEEEEKNLKPAESIFYLTSSIFLSGMLMQALNVELILSFILISVYAFMICFYVY